MDQFCLRVGYMCSFGILPIRLYIQSCRPSYNDQDEHAEAIQADSDRLDDVAGTGRIHAKANQVYRLDHNRA